MRTVKLLLTLLLVLPVASAGCASDPTRGYSAESTYPRGIATVAVPILENDTFVRGVEFELTDALIKQIESLTPYKVTAESRADSVLLGRVRRVELDQLSKSRLSGLTEEAILSVTIDFQWKDLRTNRALVERESFSGHGLFVPSQPSGEPIELGQFAVVQSLARDVVAEMRADW